MNRNLPTPPTIGRKAQQDPNKMAEKVPNDRSISPPPLKLAVETAKTRHSKGLAMIAGTLSRPPPPAGARPRGAAPTAWRAPSATARCPPPRHSPPTLLCGPRARNPARRNRCPATAPIDPPLPHRCRSTASGHTIRLLCRRSSVHHSIGSRSVNSACATASASHPSRTASRKATARARRCSSPAIPRRTAGRPPPRRARPIISMLSRWEPPTTCNRPRLAGPTYPHAHRVVTTVQCAHRWFQRDTVLSGGQRIPVGAHHDAFAATAAYPMTGREYLFETCGIRLGGATVSVT